MINPYNISFFLPPFIKVETNYNAIPTKISIKPITAKSKTLQLKSSEIMLKNKGKTNKEMQMTIFLAPRLNIYK